MTESLNVSDQTRGLDKKYIIDDFLPKESSADWFDPISPSDVRSSRLISGNPIIPSHHVTTNSQNLPNNIYTRNRTIDLRNMPCPKFVVSPWAQPPDVESELKKP